jgi:hypothetical protein
VELCGLALAGGTRVLFATPHAHAEWDHYPLTLERERLFGEAFPVVSRVVSAWAWICGAASRSSRPFRPAARTRLSGALEALFGARPANDLLALSEAEPRLLVPERLPEIFELRVEILDLGRDRRVETLGEAVPELLALL